MASEYVTALIRLMRRLAVAAAAAQSVMAVTAPPLSSSVQRRIDVGVGQFLALVAKAALGVGLRVWCWGRCRSCCTTRTSCTRWPPTRAPAGCSSSPGRGAIAAAAKVLG